MHSDGKLDAGVLWQLLDDYALLGIDLEVDGANLLVEGVDAVHELLDYLGFLGLHYDSCFHSGVDLVTRNKFEETLHRFQQKVSISEIMLRNLREFLPKYFFKQLLRNLVNKWAAHVCFELLRARLDNHTVN